MQTVLAQESSIDCTVPQHCSEAVFPSAIRGAPIEQYAATLYTPHTRSMVYITVSPVFSTWTDDHLWTGKPSRYTYHITNYTGQLSLPTVKGKRIEYRPVWLGLRWFTCVR